MEGRPAGTAAATTNVRSICDTPGERQHFDLVFVLVVNGFPFDVSDLCEDI
jgi:hypothetical protein